MQRLRARYVFPVCGEPLAGGVVTLDGVRIARVDNQSLPTEDLGNVALLPGLVNAHAHLDLSDIAAPLGFPGIALPEWIGLVVRSRRESVLSMVQRCRLGLAESLRLGTTTLADIAQGGKRAAPDMGRPEERPDVMALGEMIAPTAQRVDSALEDARQHLAWCQVSGVRPGLSPHAPYTVRPELFAAAVRLSRERHVPLAMHLAESPEEMQLLADGGGPFRELLERLGAWDPAVHPPGRRPLDYLRYLAQAHRALVIHGNYLDDQEAAFLAHHADRLAVVYCPRTHAWFGHRPYPLESLLEAGVAMAVGTDSRASSPDLSVLAELRRVAVAHPAIPLATVLRLGTLAGAAALGLADECGSLTPGKRADMVAVALPEHETNDPHELLLGGEGNVRGVWRLGRRIPVISQ